MNCPKVSVLMAVRNAERYLHEAVHSILEQTLSDFEFLVIDDCSTDRTSLMLNECARKDPRILLSRNREHIGLTKSLNRGLAVASGEYIARQDADDISLPQRLLREATFLDEHPNVGVVGSSNEYIDESGCSLGVSLRPTDPQFLRWHLFFSNPFIHASVMFRRKIVANLGGYDEKFKRSQDYDLWSRCSYITELRQLPEVLIRFRKHDNAVSSIFLEEQLDTSIGIMKRNIEAFLGRAVPYEQVRCIRTAGHGAEFVAKTSDGALDLVWDLVSAFHKRYQPIEYASRRIRRDAARRMMRIAGRRYLAHPIQTIKIDIRAVSLGFYGLQVRLMFGWAMRRLLGKRMADRVRRMVSREVW